MDQGGFDRIIMPGITVDVPAGWSRYTERVAGTLPDEAERIREFTEICESVAETARQSLVAPGSAMEGIGARWRDLRWGRRSLADLFAHCELSSVARTLLAAQSGNYGAAPSDTSVLTHASVMDHYLRGAYYPEGGGQAIVAALVEVIEAHGGELRTRQAVREILLGDRGVRGVELADGRQISAPVVVSNADYRRTILQMCAGAACLPREMVAMAREATMRLPLAILYLALDTAMPETQKANIWYLTTDDIENSYTRLQKGIWDELPSVFISFTSAKEDVCGVACPPGHSNLQVITMCPPGYAPWGVSGGPVDGVRYRRDTEYLATKRRLAEAMLTSAETAIGPLRKHIAHIESATPLTQERYTLSTGGTPYGLNRWGFRYDRPDARPDVTTDVPGLYLVGQNTRYGSGIVGAAISGITCAGKVTGRSLLAEVHAGTVVADPVLLPDRKPEWDSLAVSRGAARRDARGLARITA
jgi:all-trans-retinol 13,14-reductase